MKLNNEWQLRLLGLCEHIASWSKDPSTKVGAVIMGPDKRVLSMGYNGFPRGVEDTTERLENRDLKYKITRHAEENAVSFAKEGLEGATLACIYYPCSRCAGAIIQAGIRYVVTYQPTDDYISRWGADVDIASTMFMEAGVEVTMW